MVGVLCAALGSGGRSRCAWSRLRSLLFVLLSALLLLGTVMATTTATTNSTTQHSCSIVSTWRLLVASSLHQPLFIDRHNVNMTSSMAINID